MQQSVRQRGISGKVAVAVCAALLSVLAGQAVAGGFKSTCKHISLESPVTLRALCRIGNSGMNQSTILDLDAGLSNDSGTLKWGGRNFSQSARTSSFRTHRADRSVPHGCPRLWGYAARPE